MPPALIAALTHPMTLKAARLALLVALHYLTRKIDG